METGKKTGFFHGVKREFKKIIWPKPKEVVKQTIIVCIAVIVLGIIIRFFDMGVTALIGLMH